jgi:hypothetical protein
MGKVKSKGLDVNVDAYKFKQLQYKLGGRLPEATSIEIAEQTTMNQLMNYQMAYGVFNRVWREIVVPALVEKGIWSPMWGPYKAFTNELLKRALGLGRQRPTMTVDEVKTKWTNMGLNKDVLDAIVERIQTKGRELKIFG